MVLENIRDFTAPHKTSTNRSIQNPTPINRHPDKTRISSARRDRQADKRGYYSHIKYCYCLYEYRRGLSGTTVFTPDSLEKLYNGDRHNTKRSFVGKNISVENKSIDWRALFSNHTNSFCRWNGTWKNIYIYIGVRARYESPCLLFCFEFQPPEG